MPQGKPRPLRHANHIERSTPRLFRELSKSPDERFRPERQLPETLPLDDLLCPAMVERSRQPWAVSCSPREDLEHVPIHIGTDGSNATNATDPAMDRDSVRRL